jgi:membrane-associated phospholipid phosphatase
MMDTIVQNKLGNRHSRGARSLGLGLSLILLLLGGLLGPTPSPDLASAAPPQPAQIEPEAGTWQTWVLESGSQLRLAAPPDAQQTQAELAALKELAGGRDQAALDQIAYWNTGPAVYRWNELAADQALKSGMSVVPGSRLLALLNVAIYDATVAAWDSKYAHNRLRPSEVDPTLETVIPTPHSPAYPAEHAVVAGAASEILAYLFPDNAAAFQEKAQQAGQAFVLAGVQYPSDVEAGLALGRQVAALVIERAKQDGSAAKWEGSVPTEPGHWTGENPAAPMAGTWKTWVLASGDEVRPEPPFAYGSAELAAEMEELKTQQLTPKMIADAFFSEYAAGGMHIYWFWNEQTGQKVLEHRLDNNLPRAAQVYALTSIAFYDSFVACWDAKYAYWAVRPFQVDPTFQPLFKTPNHPSYPSAHACLSTGASETLAHLFPRDAEAIRAVAEPFLESRIWGGIHFRSDVEAGQSIGQAVSQKVIQHVQGDGSNDLSLQD